MEKFYKLNGIAAPLDIYLLPILSNMGIEKFLLFPHKNNNNFCFIMIDFGLFFKKKKLSKILSSMQRFIVASFLFISSIFLSLLFFFRR